jgi:hypothetical protein
MVFFLMKGLLNAAFQSFVFLLRFVKGSSALPELMFHLWSRKRRLLQRVTQPLQSGQLR